MIVYRLEDSEGKGPYTSTLFPEAFTIASRAADGHVGPHVELDDISWKDNWCQNWNTILFACPSKEAFDEWFWDKKELQRLLDMGFCINSYKISEMGVLEFPSGTQVAFDKTKAWKI